MYFNNANWTHSDRLSNIILYPKRLISSVALVFLFLAGVQAQPITWTGNDDFDWDNPANWSPQIVPGNTSIVSISNQLRDPVIYSGTVANCRSLTIYSGGILIIDNTAELIVKDNGITNHGKLTNTGEINIGQTQVALQGILNKGEFNNSGGTINIKLLATDGISNTDGGTFKNYNNGQVLIGQNNGQTSLNLGILNNGAGSSFENDGGTIKIDNTVDNALENEESATFSNVNNGQILIGQGDGNIGKVGIRNRLSAIFNHTGGDIIIDNTVEDGLKNGTDATFLNDINGQILIGQGDGNIGEYGIINQSGASFDNEGVIKIDNTISASLGHAISNTADFVNTSTGTVQIGQLGTTLPSDGIENGGSSAVFTNQGGSIWIDNVSTVGIRNKEGGQFVNQNSGQLNVGQSDGNIGSHGIANNSASEIINDGSTIKIGNTAGIGVQNSAVFNNLNNALIQIGQNGFVGSNGISNFGSGVINNTGSTIEIDNTDNHGVSNQSELYNTSLGEILIGQHDGNIGYVGFLITNPGALFSNDNSTVKIDDIGTNTSNTSAGIWNQVGGSVQNTNGSQIIIGASGVLNGRSITNTDPTGENTSMTIDQSSSLVAHFMIYNANEAILTNNGTINCYADLQIFEDGTINGSGVYNIEGNWINGGSFDSQGSTVAFIGSSPSTIYGPSISNFFNLTIDKSNSSVNLNIESTVSNTLHLTSGIFDSNGHNLTLNGTNASILGENSSSYIDGSNGGEVIIDVDLNNPNNNNPGNIGVNITSAANLGSTTIKRGNIVQDVNGNNSIARYYIISPSNNSGLDASVQFSYLDHELNGINESDLAPFRFNGSTWDEYSVSNANTNSNYVETENIDAFSTWTLAQAVMPLPVELVQFSAVKIDDFKVGLTWQTATEVNNEGFELEHSIDGRNWDYLGFVNGHGTSAEINDYTFTHESPARGINYYRLLQVDFDGQSEYSDIRSVEFGSLENQTNVFPNPASNHTNIQISNDFDQAHILISDLNGRTIFEQRLEEGNPSHSINVSDWQSGMYLVRIHLDGSVSTTHKLQVIKN